MARVATGLAAWQARCHPSFSSYHPGGSNILIFITNVITVINNVDTIAVLALAQLGARLGPTDCVTQACLTEPFVRQDRRYIRACDAIRDLSKYSEPMGHQRAAQCALTTLPRSAICRSLGNLIIIINNSIHPEHSNSHFGVCTKPQDGQSDRQID